ncbi:MAG TPA: shikimate kinase [Xanthobacteraceae bacterium]|nr:shikimate kinase [Xanthobacteraceae bacterium]
MPGSARNDQQTTAPAALRRRLGARSIVLVGMPGSGKTSIGRRLAAYLGIEFVDADQEIEAAAGMSIADIFSQHGEPYFRAGEARVIARLLGKGPQVIATGGGAFVNPDTRALVRARAFSVWLKADLDLLLRRVKRKNDRPLLRVADPEAVLKRLLAERESAYAEADITVTSLDVPHEAVVEALVKALAQKLSEEDAAAPAGARP